jgi:hypothetical protein
MAPQARGGDVRRRAESGFPTKHADSLFSADSESWLNNTTVTRHPPKRGKVPLQSGQVAKSTDQVIFPQNWPHIAIQSDKVGGSYSFHELDIRLFVTGELELLSSHRISPDEHEGRIRLLKQLMYLNKSYDCQAILKLYAEVVSKIERGLLIWGSSFEATITWALNNMIPISMRQQQAPQGKNKAQYGKKSSNYKTRPTYCKDFQSNSCSSSEDKHWGMVNGERMLVEHVCAACLMKKKENAYHSESSSECPCKGMRSGAQ